MKTRSRANPKTLRDLAVLLAIWPMVGIAQVPVDENGNPVGEYSEYGEQIAATSDAEIPLASPAELETLVGPVALYPDDLLAVILPASTFPLQLVEAARFLEELESDPSRKPDDDWDDSVVALTNYPEVVELLNSDLDWTWKLGEAVVAQQADVIAAIEVFRDRAYAAGNLKSDEYQNVTQEDGIIEISPVIDDIIYVPYYEPERVVLYQPRPAYYYHPRPYPVYYYPYAYGHSFNHGYFWGVTTAFTIGWTTDYLHVFHHSYHGHPYYGYTYNNRWWYRRPSINVYNSYYSNNRHHRSNDRYRRGDRWYSNNSRRMNRSDQRVTRTRYLPNNDTHVARNTRSNGFAPSTNRNDRFAGNGNKNTRARPGRDNSAQEGVRNATRNKTGGNAATNRQNNRNKSGSSRLRPVDQNARSTSNDEIRFRTRAGKPSAGRDRQNRKSTDTRARDNAATAANRSANNRSSTNRPSTNRSSNNGTARQGISKSSIRFAPRNNERKSVATPDRSKNSLRTPRPNNARTASKTARQSSNTAKKSTASQRKTTNSRRVAPARMASSQSNSSRRAQPAQREQRSSSSRPQQQRQSTPRRQESRPGNSQSRSSSKSQSASASRSKSRGNDSRGYNRHSRKN